MVVGFGSPYMEGYNRVCKILQALSVPPPSGVTRGLSQGANRLPQGEPLEPKLRKRLRNDSESLDVVDVHILDRKTKTPEKRKKNNVKNTNIEISTERAQFLHLACSGGRLALLPPVSYATASTCFFRSHTETFLKFPKNIKSFQSEYLKVSVG